MTSSLVIFPVNGVAQIASLTVWSKRTKSGARMGYEVAVETFWEVFPDAAAWLAHEQGIAQPEVLTREGFWKDDVRKVFAEIDS